MALAGLLCGALVNEKPPAVGVCVDAEPNTLVFLLPNENEVVALDVPNRGVDVLVCDGLAPNKFEVPEF